MHLGPLLPTSISDRHVNTVKTASDQKHYTIGPQILSRHDKNKTITTKEILFWDLINQTKKERKGKRTIERNKKSFRSILESEG